MYVSAVSAFLACLGLFIISASMLVLAVLVHAAEKLWKKMPQVRKLSANAFLRWQCSSLRCASLPLYRSGSADALDGSDWRSER